MIMRVPIVVDRDNKLIVGVLLYAATAVLYMTSNHWHIFTPHFLPLSSLDASVPFIPQTVWIYVSQYIYFVVIYCSEKNIVTLNRFVYAFASVVLGCVLVFWLWPTAIARQSFPLPHDLDRATRLVLTGLRRADSPTNCFPSFHVASVFLSCFIVSGERRGRFWFFLVWATVISVSTLTVKQHYFVDVLAGVGLAVGLHRVFRGFVLNVKPTPR